jgi:signal transduction histidine kinase
MLQVLINLLSNAIKFNKDNGRVRVTARMIPGGHAELHVEDSGSGIPEGARERVFERNYQVEQADRKTEGSGIGLSIVKQILDSHGCRIGVESALGEGSRFRFTMPLSPQQPGASRVAQEPLGDEPAPEPFGGEPEDEADVPAQPRFRIIRPERPESF